MKRTVRLEADDPHSRSVVGERRSLLHPLAAVVQVPLLVAHVRSDRLQTTGERQKV